ncbi:UNVERIFIED_CONTAM: hypothetical protein GTU68_001109 [Idotea baltica]|nr:hypothetical protein [Idotea baltica]
MGKHKAIYTPHVECGDFVIVLNCDKIRFSGKKLAEKEYDRYTGYPGGRRIETGADLLEKNPTKIMHEAVRRMLPKNKLGRRMLAKLKLVVGDTHPHQAQNPVAMPEYLL